MYTLRVEYAMSEESYVKFYIIEESSFVKEGILYEGFGGERFEPGSYTTEEVEFHTEPIGKTYATIESARRAVAALSTGVLKKARAEFEQYIEGLEV